MGGACFVVGLLLALNWAFPHVVIKEPSATAVGRFLAPIWAAIETGRGRLPHGVLGVALLVVSLAVPWPHRPPQGAEQQVGATC